ncbi:MAG: hypothetical protein IPM48_01315 [Saprospiraceae bacterium]|nr:hypothetical protein [Saprospiraceae bacterium]
MKKRNLTFYPIFSGKRILVIPLLFCFFLFTGLSAQQAYNIPPLKTADQSVTVLTQAFDALYPQAKQAGPNSQEYITVQLYKRVLDAISNRPDPNMDTYAVLLSSMDMNYYNNLVVRSGNAINLDESIRRVLNTQEYQSLIGILRQ